MTYDVIIAGAGPAGSMAALVLSRAGKRVLVLEKAHFPRTKVCGYSLNPRSWSVWKRHGLTEDFMALPHLDMAGFTLEKEGAPVVRHRFHSQRTRALDRGLLDAWLAGEARASGAEYRFGIAVQGITPTEVHTSAGSFAAPIIIGADGRNSLVGRLSQLARPSPPCGRVGWQTFLTPPLPSDHVHMNIFPEGYYGMNRIDAERSTLTMVLFAHTKVTPDQILARYLPGANSSAWKSLSPISRNPWELTNGRAWLVGDAARLLEPLTGEGIYSALVTGEMAARHILTIDRIGVKQAMRNYHAQHRRFYGPRTLINSLVHWALADPRRSLRIMDILKWWPAAVSHLVEQVQKPENPRLQLTLEGV